MTTQQAKQIAANPAAYPDQLKLAHLKLGNVALRTMASSPVQREIKSLMAQIEAMPREMWVYHP